MFQKRYTLGDNLENEQHLLTEKGGGRMTWANGEPEEFIDNLS